MSHHIIAKIRNNSPSPFLGNVEMSLQFSGYGLVYRNRVFNLNLPAKGQIVTMKMPCDVPAEQLRMDDLNAIGIQVGMDPDKKIPELNENNNLKFKKFPYGITSIALTLLPDSYRGACNASTQIAITARIAFRSNLKVTERYKIVLESTSYGYRKEYRNADFEVTTAPGTHTVSKQIVLPADLAAQIQHGTLKASLRVELIYPLKNMVSNTATFTYYCR
jgi:hypothetical protein